VPTDPSDVQAALVESARILARGGHLEAKLDALAAQVDRLTGSGVAVVYLLDAGSRSLVPAGAHGLSEDDLAAATVALDESDDPIARAAVDRSAVTRSGGDASGAPKASALHGVPTLVCLPLLADEVGSDPEVQGVLAAGLETADASSDVMEVLGAMADLAAVIIRDARLEQALIERSDWLDRMANTDPLTGLANRRTFERVLELELQRSARQASPLSVVLFRVGDLDGLRDRDGHRVADDVLRIAAATLGELVRWSIPWRASVPTSSACSPPGQVVTPSRAGSTTRCRRSGPRPARPSRSASAWDGSRSRRDAGEILAAATAARNGSQTPAS
jgi:GAF domain-containing protein